MNKRLYMGFGIAGVCLLAWALAGSLGFRRAPESLVYHGKSVKTWALQLTTTETKSHDEATSALKALGPSAVPGLVRLLQAKDSFFRQQVWVVVPRLSGSFQKIIVNRIDPPNAAALRTASARSLGVIGPDAVDAVPALARALRNEDAQVRWNAAGALGRIGPAAWPELSNALAARDVNLRYAAICALGDSSLEATVVVPELLKALDDTNSGVSVAAAGSLAKLGPTALPVLAQGLDSGDAATRTRAAHALPLIRLPRDQTLTLLLGLMLDAEPSCRAQAARSLASLGIPNASMIDAVTRMLGDSAPEPRLAAAETLRQWHRWVGAKDALGKIGPGSGE